MHAIVAGIAGLCSWFLAKFSLETVRSVSLSVARYFAEKALLIFLICVVLPIVLFNVSVMITEAFIDSTLTYLQAQGDVDSVVVTLSGLGGWMAAQLKIPQIFSISVTLLTVKATLKMARIIR